MENDAPLHLQNIEAWDLLLRFLQSHLNPEDSDYVDALLYDIDYGQVKDGKPVTGDAAAWATWARMLGQRNWNSEDTVVATPRQLYELIATFVEEFGDAPTSEHIAGLVLRMRRGPSNEDRNDDNWMDWLRLVREHPVSGHPS